MPAAYDKNGLYVQIEEQEPFLKSLYSISCKLQSGTVSFAAKVSQLQDQDIMR